jgi:predicted glycoside hydrolase/deacetylase ChbG (UPF0249 family)
MASQQGNGRKILVITADDYGYWPSYNRGILDAVAAGAVDSVSAMVDGRRSSTATTTATRGRS